MFGGLQVILSGDFYQLPPVKDPLYGDNGDYCFNCSFFADYFQHVVVLKDIMRQNEPKLVQAVNELECGFPSKETNEYLTSLERPLSTDDSSITKLHARNFEVDLCNYQNLQTIDKPAHIFEAVDEGDTYYLNRMIVQKVLPLKISAKVMLLRNLSDIYVNGLIGHIVAIEDDCISVDFKGAVIKVTRYMFSKFDPVMGVALATRYQFPLKLAYSVTIHKAQGMSLPFVEVDCKFATNAGQIGVAVGRAISSNGLRVLNYSPYRVGQHPQSVYNFYNNIRSVTEFPESTSQCCKHDYDNTVNTCEAEHDDSDISDTDSEDDLIADLHHFHTCSSIGSEHSYSSGGISHTDFLEDFEMATHDFIGEYLLVF